MRWHTLPARGSKIHARVSTCFLALYPAQTAGRRVNDNSRTNKQQQDQADPGLRQMVKRAAAANARRALASPEAREGGTDVVGVVGVSRGIAGHEACHVAEQSTLDLNVACDG